MLGQCKHLIHEGMGWYACAVVLWAILSPRDMVVPFFRRLQEPDHLKGFMDAVSSRPSLLLLLLLLL